MSVIHDHVYFSALGPRRGKPMIPDYDPRSDRRSDIFRFPFHSEDATIEAPTEILKPLFQSAGLATRPTVSPDGSLVAFLRSRTGMSSYHYNLVIADQNGDSERLVGAPGLGSSRPVIIDHDVYVSSTGRDRVLIEVSRRGEPSMQLLADIDDASIAKATVVGLNIDP